MLEKNGIIESQNEKIIDSITYAQYIQKSLLADEGEIKKHLPNSFILFKPKDIVSGDFYWFSTINDKIIIKSRNVSHAPRYAYPIVSGDYVERNSKIIYKRIPRKDGC